MSGLRQNLRSSIIETLELLSSAERQLAYKCTVSGIPVTNELVSMWLDDFYVPDSDAFKKSFSIEELEALSEFDRYFSEHESLLPKAQCGVSECLRNERWQEIMRRAAKALAALQADGIAKAPQQENQ